VNVPAKTEVFDPEISSIGIPAAKNDCSSAHNPSRKTVSTLSVKSEPWTHHFQMIRMSIRVRFEAVGPLPGMVY